jgi:hypothetical protein
MAGFPDMRKGAMMRSARKGLVIGLTCFQFCLFASTASSANRVLDFETGTLDGWQEEGGDSGDIRRMPQITTEHVLSGKYAVKSDLNGLDPDRYLRERQEMKVKDLGKEIQKGQVYWYGFSIYLQSPYPFDTGHDEVLAQMHKVADVDLGENNGNPTLGFWLTKGYNGWTITNIADPRLITPVDKSGVIFKRYEVGPYETDKWTDWVVNVKWSYNSDGFLKVWKNGKLVVDVTGPNCSNDRLGPNFKMGIYKSSWEHRAPTPGITRRIVYHDEFRFAGADGSYESVAPRHGARPVPPTLSVTR